MDEFSLVSDYRPAGDQPEAIDALAHGIEGGKKHQTLLGVTGSGKTFTVANVVVRVNRPTLVICHNKTLAAQLCSEFRAFFPENAVEYFVSYYDYYQPEAYIPQNDQFIEKDFAINDEIERLRHRCTQALLTRRDVIIVASVSCIFGLGRPDDYRAITMIHRRGDSPGRDSVLKRLVDMQYERNDVELARGKFRVRGGTVELCTVEDTVLRIEFSDDTISRITELHPVTGENLGERDSVMVFPATHFIIPPEKMERAMKDIEAEMLERVEEFKKQNKLVEAQRIEQRTRFDMEMMREVGYCSGIENYSRLFDGRAPGEPPSTLLAFFPKDFITVIDESHVTIPQVRGMYGGDRSRKETLVEYGFRLPSALDNRPLKFDEFEARIGQVIFTSATPGPYELRHSGQPVEQIIRPTGLVDPEISLRPVKGQVDDLIGEINTRVKRGERALVTTLTKKMAEDLSAFLEETSIKVHYLHSEVETLRRVELLRDLRLGKYDVLVGINLLREGLDLPEVSLVAILDADREGFLRSEVSLIQTIGRAARHVSGSVIMYADNVTGSMKRAIDETNRRRRIQIGYNERNGIVPQSVRKEVRAILAMGQPDEDVGADNNAAPRKYSPQELELLIISLEEEMNIAAQALEFEKAAQIRDRIKALKGGGVLPQTGADQKARPGRYANKHRR